MSITPYSKIILQLPSILNYKSHLGTCNDKHIQRNKNLLPKTGGAFTLFITSDSEMKFVIVIPTFATQRYMLQFLSCLLH